MKETNGTKNKIIRKEFVSLVKASFSRIEAESIIHKAKDTNFDESYCFEIYEKVLSFNV